MLLSINFMSVGGGKGLSHFLLSDFKLLRGIARGKEVGKPHELTVGWQSSAFGNYELVIMSNWRRLAGFQFYIKMYLFSYNITAHRDNKTKFTVYHIF